MVVVAAVPRGSADIAARPAGFEPARPARYKRMRALLEAGEPGLLGAWGNAGKGVNCGTASVWARGPRGDGEEGKKTRLGEASSIGLSRFRNRSELLHHTEHVHLERVFDDLAVDHSIDGSPYELNRTASCEAPTSKSLRTWERTAPLGLAPIAIPSLTGRRSFSPKNRRRARPLQESRRPP